MRIAATPRSIRRLIVLLFAVLGRCVSAGGYNGGYGYDDASSVGYGVGFYEPHGYDYGGWRPGYRVGPPRTGNERRARSDSPSPRPAYRPAAQSRPMPSIPTHPRGGQSGENGRRSR